MDKNIILKTDSYKFSHWKQYPPGITREYSYFEARKNKPIVFFGLQYLLKKYLTGMVVTQEMVAEAEELVGAHMGPGIFNSEGWTYIAQELGGRLPIEVRAVPEGMVVPGGNVLMTVENTDDRCFWLTSYLETLLSQVWYPSSVATRSYEYATEFKRVAALTGGSEDVSFKLHDFGFRGSTSLESAGLGGAAHLLVFRGSGTMAAAEVLRDYYGAREMPALSVPAAEHSTITSWGRDREFDAYRNMLDQFPTGPVAVVSDSYDIYRAVADGWGQDLKDAVLARDGQLVVRPDSGYPPEVVVRVLQELELRFGSVLNERGYKSLNPKVAVLQGDGMDFEGIQEVMVAMVEAGWSTDSVAFGCGGGLLQKVSRSTYDFVFKCSQVIVDGVPVNVFKDPVTDPNKVSKRGRLMLSSQGGWCRTLPQDTGGHQDLMVPIFKDGEMLQEWTLSDIRKRVGMLA